MMARMKRKHISQAEANQRLGGMPAPKRHLRTRPNREPQDQVQVAEPSSDIDVQDTDESKPTSLMDLPPQIRKNFYQHLVVDESPIKLYPKYYGAKVGVKKLGPKMELGILFTNKTIAEEVAETLYQENTFRMESRNFRNPPYDVWRRLWRWLDMIGAQNRRSLRSLDIQQDELPHIVQRIDGKREYPPERYRYNDIPRGPGKVALPPLQRCEELRLELPAMRGIVESISPCVKKVFELLAPRYDGLHISIEAPVAWVPGVGDRGGPVQMTADLPKLVEWWRVHILGGRGLDIVWTTAVRQYDPDLELGYDHEDFDEKVERCGWTILDISEKKHPGREYP